jgi:hypothetical protein
MAQSKNDQSQTRQRGGSSAQHAEAGRQSHKNDDKSSRGKDSKSGR